MSTDKHTPGPWTADWDDNGQWYIEPLGITGTKLRGDSANCVEAANAHLIAAAPDMLSALKGAQSELQRLMDVVSAEDADSISAELTSIAAALEKAEG